MEKRRQRTRCPACAELYRRDTFQLITAGLRGGKGTPETVAAHPRVFATFTAPGFGPVHNRRADGRPCRCSTRHDPDDTALGTPLDPDTYDYQAAVLWNAHCCSAPGADRRGGRSSRSGAGCGRSHRWWCRRRTRCGVRRGGSGGCSRRGRRAGGGYRAGFRARPGSRVPAAGPEWCG
ncbi:replication initiator [Streptomyces sp. YIM S03343]